LDELIVKALPTNGVSSTHDVELAYKIEGETTYDSIPSRSFSLHRRVKMLENFSKIAEVPQHAKCFCRRYGY
jgi:hypothetical protein